MYKNHIAQPWPIVLDTLIKSQYYKYYYISKEMTTEFILNLHIQWDFHEVVCLLTDNR